MKTEQTLPTEVVTANSEQLAVLKNNFPQCFDRQGKFILSKLQDVLQANAVDVSRESYSLNWLGKSYARVLANEPIRTMLSEEHEHNQQEHNKNSHNLLIQGDNLEVLKHLKGAYTNKIKMIYIDPPYNTGSDGFVYQDDRSFSPEQFAELAGIDLDEAKRVLDFTQSNANSHSAWLTFIYPRLYVAKQLLKDDGVIFISIDDSEQAQLKILCDEIFGEGNFISQICHKARASISNDKILSSNHNIILLYAKNYDMVFAQRKKIGLDPDLTGFDLEDTNGSYKLAPVDGPGGAAKGNPYYTFQGVTNYWRFSKDTMQEMYDKNLLVIKNNSIQQKYYLEDAKRSRKTISTWWDEKFYTSSATTYVKNLLGRKVFSNPKPVSLIQRMLELFCYHSENEIILDFFGGSGTTAEAVLKFNSEKRILNFIVVQIDEKLDSTPKLVESNKESIEYCDELGLDRSIFEITKARIVKVSEGYNNTPVGFKIFKTIDNFLPLSNYRELKQLTLSQSDTPLSTTVFDNAQLQDILTTWKGLDKILLSENLNAINLDDYIAYGFRHVLYLVNQGFNTAALKELIKKLDDEHEFQVSKLVILGHHFDSKSQREIYEAMKNYSNKKSIPVDVVVRY